MFNINIWYKFVSNGFYLNKKKDRSSLERKFKKTDINGDGFITYDEFREMLYALFNGRTDDDEINRLFRIMDKDGNGQITVDGMRQFIKSYFLISFNFYFLF